MKHHGPAITPERWRQLIRTAISAEQCRHLGRAGFPALSRRLLHLRGDEEASA